MQPRVATPADVPELLRVINAAYRVEEFFIIGDRLTEAETEARIARPNAAFLVLDAEVPGRLTGAVYVEIHGDRGYFGVLSVDPGRQGEGLGRRLVEAAEAHCRAAGCLHLDMDVVDLRTELPPFYAKLGFTPCGTAPFGNPEKLKRPATMILMTKPLSS